MHFSQMNDKGGTKFSKLAIVAALHVAVGAAFIHTLNSRGVAMPKMPEELVVMFTPEARRRHRRRRPSRRSRCRKQRRRKWLRRRWKCRCSSHRRLTPSSPRYRPKPLRSRRPRRRSPSPPLPRRHKIPV